MSEVDSSKREGREEGMAQEQARVLAEQAADVRRLRVKLLNAMDSLGHLKKLNPAP